MSECDLCLTHNHKIYTVIGDMMFCDTCYTKVKRLVRNYVTLKNVRRTPYTDKYVEARTALEKSLRT